ncbi:MAG: glycosyltransferase [Bacteroidales bacterium]
MFLSIIVPIYNIAGYINNCIKSLLNPDINNNFYEIIIIDDGSIDNSLEIVKDFANKYQMIKVVSQKNQGAAAARNRGINEAQGDYLWFVDGDDYIETNFIKFLLKEIKEMQADIFLFQMALGADLEKQFDKTVSYNLEPGRIYTGEQVLKNGIFPSSACNAIYRRDFLKQNNFIFNKESYREDVEFTGKVFCLANSIKYIPLIGYYYFTRPGSKTQNISLNNRIHLLDAEITIANSFLRFGKSTKKQHPWINRYMKERANMVLFNMMLSIYRDKEIPFEAATALLEKSKNLSLYPLDLYNSGSIKHRCMWFLFNLEIMYVFMLKMNRLRG